MACGTRSALRPALCRRTTHGTPLLEAFTAEHGTPLRRAERNCRFLPALRTGRFSLRPLEVTLARALRAFRFAVLTPLGLVLKALVGEKHLFAGGENKLLTAFRTLQDLIVVFHTLLRDSALVQSPQHLRPHQIGLRRYECGSLPDLSEAAQENRWVAPSAWGVSPAPAAASCVNACGKAPVLRDAFRQASCSNCVS